MIVAYCNPYSALLLGSDLWSHVRQSSVQRDEAHIGRRSGALSVKQEEDLTQMTAVCVRCESKVSHLVSDVTYRM